MEEELKNPTLPKQENVPPPLFNLQKTHGYYSIDDEMQKINLDLNHSYQLFQTIADRFESINFGCLKSRIKDVHLEGKNNDIKVIVNDLKNTFDQKYVDNRLSELTQEMAGKFRRHPGEFGDIPELSEFFKVCTQFQHGLEKLKRQRNDVQDITKRMTHIIEISCDRVTELQKKLELDSGDAKLRVDNNKEMQN